MGRDEEYSDEKIYWLGDPSAAEPAGDTPPRRPWPKWFTLAVAALIVAAVVAVLNNARRTPPAAPVAAAPANPAPSNTASSSSATAVIAAPATTPPVRPVAPAVTPLGHSLLDVTAGWELFGRGNGVLVRIQPAAGRITRTEIPALRSGGPVSLLAGTDRVILRPWDNVPAYLVRDGQPARQLSPLLNQEGPVFPGPLPDQMWVRPADDHRPVMALATLDGKRLAGFVQVPAGSLPFEAVADGAGYLLYAGVGGVYDARPEGLRRISTGALLAVGPTGWLAVECDEQYRCQTVLISRADGSRETVADGGLNRISRGGVISPDGSTAAVLSSGPNGSVELSLLDLASHQQLRVPGVAVTQETMDGAMVFSPDSRWLFAVTTDGTVVVVNPRTRAVSPLDAPLPPLNQLVLRPAAAADEAPSGQTSGVQHASWDYVTPCRSASPVAAVCTTS
ncbi:MAG TPA: hypothetical protein VGX49_05265 [Jatrophihabitans sp.]|nr:hypothetical protein [Jatrophihabitans sp.]